jgi:hypothetical protein
MLFATGLGNQACWYAVKGERDEDVHSLTGPVCCMGVSPHVYVFVGGTYRAQEAGAHATCTEPP